MSRRTSKTATAWDEFRALLALANRSNHTARKALAEESIRGLESELNWLLIEVSPAASAQNDLEVLPDGKALGSASWGVRLPVDPGVHKLEARSRVHPWGQSAAERSAGRGRVQIRGAAGAHEGGLLMRGTF